MVVLLIADWCEGLGPAFITVPGIARNVLYILRVITGFLLLLGSPDSLADASTLLRKPASAFIEIPQEEAV